MWSFESPFFSLLQWFSIILLQLFSNGIVSSPFKKQSLSSEHTSSVRYLLKNDSKPLLSGIYTSKSFLEGNDQVYEQIFVYHNVHHSITYSFQKLEYV